MSKNAIKGVPALLGDARRALLLNQAQLADLLGSSKRTVQRWETKRATPSPRDLATLAAHVYPHDAETAADLAAAIGQTLESLGIRRAAGSASASARACAFSSSSRSTADAA